MFSCVLPKLMESIQCLLTAYLVTHLQLDALQAPETFFFNF